jgi:hypothetical protein
MFREDEEIEKQILNKGFKNETLQKNLECKARIIEVHQLFNNRGRKNDNRKQQSVS